MSETLTAERAHLVLGTSPATSPDERRRVFLEKTALLERKLSSAPTDGLRVRYREQIESLTSAIEFLEGGRSRVPDPAAARSVRRGIDQGQVDHAPVTIPAPDQPGQDDFGRYRPSISGVAPDPFTDAVPPMPETAEPAPDFEVPSPAPLAEPASSLAAAPTARAPADEVPPAKSDSIADNRGGFSAEAPSIDSVDSIDWVAVAPDAPAGTGEVSADDATLRQVPETRAAPETVSGTSTAAPTAPTIAEPVALAATAADVGKADPPAAPSAGLEIPGGGVGAPTAPVSEPETRPPVEDPPQESVEPDPVAVDPPGPGAETVTPVLPAPVEVVEAPPRAVSEPVAAVRPARAEPEDDTRKPRRPKGLNPAWMIAAGVVVVVLALVWWSGKVDRDIAQQQEQREVAERLQFEERERMAAAAAGAELEERRQETDRATRRRIAIIESEIEALAVPSRRAERMIADLAAIERGLPGNAPSWEIDYIRKRRALCESWLDDSDQLIARHPARAHAKAAGDLLAVGDTDGAAAEATAGEAALRQPGAASGDRELELVGRPLVAYVDKVASDLDRRADAAAAGALYERLRRDDPGAAADAALESRAALRYLDDLNQPVDRTHERTHMVRLARLAGTADADVQRWQLRFELAARPAPAIQAALPVPAATADGRQVRSGSEQVAAAAAPAPAEPVATAPKALPESHGGPGSGSGWTIPDLDLAMAWIGPGAFVMGSPETEAGRNPNEGPTVRVRISQGFWIGIHEVNQRDWTKLMASSPSRFADANGLAPVEQVSWTESAEFCRRLTELEQRMGRIPPGYVYRLPTEAEWEFACRAGTTTSWSADADLSAWYSKNSRRRTRAPGEKIPWQDPAGEGDSGPARFVTRFRVQTPNPWGLFNMHGNVAEWCADRFGAHPGGTLVDPAGAPAGPSRVVRGGSWKSSRFEIRSAARTGVASDDKRDDVGFRVVLAREL